MTTESRPCLNGQRNGRSLGMNRVDDGVNYLSIVPRALASIVAPGAPTQLPYLAYLACHHRPASRFPSLPGPRPRPRTRSAAAVSKPRGPGP